MSYSEAIVLGSLKDDDVLIRFNYDFTREIADDVANDLHPALTSLVLNHNVSRL